MEMIDDEAIRDLLYARTHQRGKPGLQGEFAAVAGVSQAFLSRIISGKEKPTDKVARALGYRRVAGFVKVEDAGVTVEIVREGRT